MFTNLEEGQEPEQSVKKRISREKFEKTDFITFWLLGNLFGWMIGIYSLAGRGRYVYPHLDVAGMWQLPDAIGQILAMICVPLGLGLGIIQSFQLGRWKIAKIPWILVTFLGWTLPVFGFSRIRWYLLFHDPMGNGFATYLDLLWILYPLALLCIGGGIGLLQTFVMGKSISRPRLWVLTNALGLLVFGWLVNGIFRIALAPNFTDIISLAERGDPLIPPYLVWPATAAILPFLATLIIALPSGLVLWSFGNRSPGTATETTKQAA